ncbi:MAG: hypothetical protein IPO21_06920 [Bacteroidales bacterium]|nr:hypothetical protein [Bacteroidales bacterium]
MRVKIIFAFALLFTFSTMTIIAQESDSSSTPSRTETDDIQTLIKIKPDTHKGFYASVGVSMGYMNGNEYYERSFNPGIIVNRKFALGFEVSNFAANIDVFAKDDSFEFNSDFDGRSGGLFFAPIFFSTKVVHFSFPITLGVGELNGYAYRTDAWGETFLLASDDDYYAYIRPGVEVEINLRKRVRLGLNARYQHAIGVNFDDIYDLKNPLNGVVGGVNLKIGLF